MKNMSLTGVDSISVNSWPFMSSPAPLLVTFATYLLFVLKVGPSYMKDRKPMNLSLFIRCYNVFQVIACSFFIHWIVNRGITHQSTWRCAENRKDPEAAADLAYITWLFLCLRLIELIETVIFVLRKKQNQVSPLHLYHHISTVVLLWSFMKYSPSEMGIYICGINSCVHVIMYSYYFLSSFSSLRGSLKFVKKSITIIQLAQLVLILGHSIVALLPSCKASNLFIFQALNGFILIAFFLKFYINSYLKSGKKVA